MKRWIKKKSEVTADEILKFLDSLQHEYSFNGDRELRLSGYSTIKNPKDGSVILVEQEQMEKYKERLCNKHILIMSETSGGAKWFRVDGHFKPR